MEWGVPSDLDDVSLPDTSVDGCPQFPVVLELLLVPWDEFDVIPIF